MVVPYPIRAADCELNEAEGCHDALGRAAGDVHGSEPRQRTPYAARRTEEGLCPTRAPLRPPRPPRRLGAAIGGSAERKITCPSVGACTRTHARARTHMHAHTR